MNDFIGCLIGAIMGSIIGVTIALILNDYWQLRAFKRWKKSPLKTYRKEWEREMVNPYANNEFSKPKVVIRTEEEEWVSEQNENDEGEGQV
jgi:hypothetical protein